MISSQAKNASLPLEAIEIKEGIKLENKMLHFKVKFDTLCYYGENIDLSEWEVEQITSDHDLDEKDPSISLYLHFTRK